MNDDWLRVIAQGETMRVDFKAAHEWDGNARAALAEDIVAMANIRDGGVLLIGVAEAQDGSASIDGLTPQQVATFDPTKVCEYVATYFQPLVNLTIERPMINDKQLIAIRVAEFDASPVICIKDGPEKPNIGGKVKRYFYAGNLIVRTPAAKSEAIRTAEDMHAIIRLGVTKTSNQLLADFRRVLEGSTALAPALPHEREVAQWSQALEACRTTWEAECPGYGVIAMAFLPSPLGKVLDHAAMRKLVRQSQVQWEGWSIPNQYYEGRFATIQNRVSLVEGVLEIEKYQELWQLHASGAFMFARMLHYLEKGSERRLPFEEVIYSTALGVLFAQRIYQDLVPDGQVELQFSLLGTKGQRLGTFNDFMRRLSEDYRSGEEVIRSHVETTVLDLRSAWRSIVHRLVKDLFVLFNWDIAPVVVDQRLDEMEGKKRR